MDTCSKEHWTKAYVPLEFAVQKDRDFTLGDLI